MIHRVLRVFGWIVDFLFAKLDYDEDGVIACVREIGANKKVVRSVMDMMDSGRLNCGFTFSNPEIKRAVICIGPTSSSKQFVNTLSHEIHHLVVAIAESLGYDLDAEEPAYLTGDTTMALIDTICQFGCSHCSD